MDVLTDGEAQRRMEAHHAQLVAAVVRTVEAFERAYLADDEPAAQDAAMRFQSLLEDEIVPHAAGEERSFYAAAEPFNPSLVASLIEEHEALRSRIEACGTRAADLGEPEVRLAFLGLAHEIQALFSAHAHKEDRFVTPLVRDRTPHGTVARLFEVMHALPAVQ
jgi:hypothetical protein